MDAFEEIKYRTNLWNTFPRSTAMIVGAITLLVTRDSWYALQACLSVWFTLFLIKKLLPSNIAELNMWNFVSIPVHLVGLHPIRRILYIITLIIALVIGTPLSWSFAALGGLLIIDYLF